MKCNIRVNMFYIWILDNEYSFIFKPNKMILTEISWFRNGIQQKCSNRKLINYRLKNNAKYHVYWKSVCLHDLHLPNSFCHSHQLYFCRSSKSKIFSTRLTIFVPINTIHTKTLQHGLAVGKCYSVPILYLGTSFLQNSKVLRPTPKVIEVTHVCIGFHFLHIPDYKCKRWFHKLRTAHIFGHHNPHLT